MRGVRIAVPVFLCLCFFERSTANPVSVYTLPVISEVQMTDSTHWSIELGGSSNIAVGFHPLTFLFPCLRPPCSTSLFRLRIVSSGKIYTTKFFVNNDSIAVLTRASVTGIPLAEEVVIQDNDTIQVLDTMWNDSIQQYYCWSFIVRPVKPGNSLVDFWGGGVTPSTGYDWRNPFETSRPSIGSRGNYTTTHELCLMDSLHNTLSEVWIYEDSYDNNYGVYFTLFRRKLTSTLTYTDVVSLATLNDRLALSCDSIPLAFTIFPPASSLPWTGTYIDTTLSLKDTVICPCAPAGIHNKKVASSPAATRFSALPRTDGGITFIIAAPSALTNATVGIYSIAGKLLASLNISAAAGGTHSLSWAGRRGNRSKIPAGTYLCRLIMDGSAMASETVTLR